MKTLFATASSLAAILLTSATASAITIDLTELIFGPGRGEIVGDFTNGIASRTSVVKCVGVHNEVRLYEEDPGFVLGRGSSEFWRSFRDYRAVAYRTKMNVITYSNGLASLKSTLAVPGMSMLEQTSMNSTNPILVKNDREMIIAGEDMDGFFPDPRNRDLKVVSSAIKLPLKMKLGQRVTTLGRFSTRVPVRHKFGYRFPTTRGLSFYSLMECQRVE